jgi:ATP-binding cassette subfamily F protein uup
MPLITLQNVDYSVGGPLLLEKAELSIEPGERIALIGRNGAGKSTLMKLMAGELKPDDGEVRVQQGVRVTRLEQEVPHGAAGSVFDVVADGLGELGHWLAEFHRLSHAEVFDGDAMGKVQAKIDGADGWALDQRVAETLTKLELDGEAEFGRLSGGMKRRVLLARALVAGPDVLLLDEPTNHLDIEAIDWLEGFLKGWNGCVVFVTHDRRFLRALATRIVEIDRGQVTSWIGRTTSAAARNASTRRPRRTPASTSCWRRKRSGSGRASRPAVPATKGACAGSRPCATSAASAASWAATSSWKQPARRTPARRSSTSRTCPSPSASG